MPDEFEKVFVVEAEIAVRLDGQDSAKLSTENVERLLRNSLEAFVEIRAIRSFTLTLERE